MRERGECPGMHTSFPAQVTRNVTATLGPVSPIGCSVGISGPPGGVTGAASLLFETGCLGVRI